MHPTKTMVDAAMALLFLGVLMGGGILTWLSRGIQFRSIPLMLHLLLKKPQPPNTASGAMPGGAMPGATIDARKALFTAMSTTIGIGNMVGPIVAIGWGGPGALVCYLVASMLGAATTFSEVFLAVKYRTQDAQGRVHGGPMPYLAAGLAPWVAKMYAIAGSVLLLGWSTSQSNTLGRLLAPYGVAPAYTGLFLALAMVGVLWGGIQRVGQLNERMVPLMFVLYCGATGWIIAQHASALPRVFSLVWTSFWNPRAVASGLAVGSSLEVLRWGLARAVQANEAGVGTSCIPHSMVAGRSPLQQGVLAMASVYANGALCLLTGITILVTGAWQQPEAVFDITMLNRVFTEHFPRIGQVPLGISAVLFAFGTLLGNCYNGSQCFLYWAKARYLTAYQLAAGTMVFLGTGFGLKFVWGFVDFLVVPVAIPHILGVVWLAWRGKIPFDLKEAWPTRAVAPRTLAAESSQPCGT